MAIVLSEESRPARVTAQGSDGFTLTEGNVLTLAYFNPSRVYELNETVPAGETWQVTLNVYIVKT